MEIKRKHKICIELYKTLNNLNPMKETFELILCSRSLREQSIQTEYKYSKNEQVAFGTKRLGSLGQKI